MPKSTRFVYERNAQAWDRHRSRKLFERAWLDRFFGLVPAGRCLPRKLCCKLLIEQRVEPRVPSP